MRTMFGAGAIAALLLAGGIAAGQGPLFEIVADKVIQKYQSQTCEQLWEARGKPKSPEEEHVITFLRGDPSLRTQFLNRVAGPIANKMFECGMIP